MNKNVLLTKIKDQYDSIPKIVKKVVFRGAIIWLGFVICYYYILLPQGKFIQSITHLTTIFTTYLLNHLYITGFYSIVVRPFGESIRLGSRNILLIMDSCNAFKLFVLYTGFLMCAPGGVKRKLIYILIGLPIIFILNITRCYGVALLVLKKPEWIYIAHHYLFTIVVYSTIFLLWLSFLKGKNELSK